MDIKERLKQALTETPERLAWSIAVLLAELDDALVDVWTVADVKSLKPSLTDVQARAVLAYVEREYDANEGLSNDVIRSAAGIFGG